MAETNLDSAAGGSILSRGRPHLQYLSSGLGELAHSARLLSASGQVVWSTNVGGLGGAGRDGAGASGAAALALGGQSACHLDGQRGGLAELAEPVRDPGGAVAGALLLCTRAQGHCSEHVLLLRQAALGVERELAAHAEREALEERQEEILRILSHDLRTPLSTLLMQAQLLRRGHGEGAKLQKRVDAILWSGTRLNTMIQELVDLGRLESGRMKITPRAVAVAPFWAEVLDRLTGVLDVPRIAVHLAPDLPAVLADPEKLERILVNLLSNALRLSPSSEPVLLEVSAARGTVVFSVGDRGAGIPREEQPRIFERFHRSAGANGASEGLGLGLYLAKRLVEAQGGSIGVKSEPGAGSTFEVCLPAAVEGRRSTVES